MDLFYHNLHCKHIIFGGSGDSGYAGFLNTFAHSADINKNVTLLEGVPFAWDLKRTASKFLTAKFDSIFRTSKIVAPASQSLASPVQGAFTIKSVSSSEDVKMPGLLSDTQKHELIVASNGTQMPSNPQTSNGTQLAGTKRSAAQMSDPPPPIEGVRSRPAPAPFASYEYTPTYRSPTSTSSGYTPTYQPPPSNSSGYSPTYRPPPVSRTIFQNKYGQRLDLPMECDKDFFKVLYSEKSKLCNNYYLKGNCPFGPTCQWGE